jgi:hypothetical protein
MAKKSSKLPVAMPMPTDNYKPNKADVERERRYRAEDALRAIQRADEVRKDKGLMKDVKTYVKEQAKLASKL